jgi:very-short-patch-repair endonuclease/DNA-binding CsgD family transcriptional regulator
MEKEILQKLVDEGKSQVSIARELNSSHGNVQYWLRKHGLKTNPIYNNTKNKNYSSRFDWNKIQEYYDQGHTINECALYFNMSRGTIVVAAKNNKFKTRSIQESIILKTKLGKGKKTDKQKKERSELKKKYYKENPEKHPNFSRHRNRNKMSYPEKLAYCFFEDNKFKFEHDFRIGKFWVDFLLIDTKQVIEIDGEYWHKNRKEYDAKRDLFIESLGYKVIRFSAKNILAQLNIFFNLEYKMSREESDLKLIEKKSKSEKIPCLGNCGKMISPYGKLKRCFKCRTPLKDKTNHYNKVKNKPTKEELQFLISNKSYSAIGKQFGVTGNTIKKWSINYEIYVRKLNPIPERQCCMCLNKFKTKSNNSNQKFCSKKCYNKEQNRGKKPSLEQLMEDMETMYFSQIAKKYEVSPTVPRDWAISYGIHKRKIKSTFD